ncbi:hypothetical protein [Flavobacterium sp. FlaQc-47]|uniref:hypothetical protein n=1 Tax=Flavobacterium sp. FlaQc-47 TaxID=3374180 RepID=UPI003756494B
MKVTKRLKIILVILVILFSTPFLFYKLQGTRIHWLKLDSKNIGDDAGDIFVIQNPPSSKEELIILIEKMNDTLDLKSKIKKKYYLQAFYEETFNLTRFYKPYNKAFIGTRVDIKSDDAEFTKEHIVDYLYKNDISDKDCGDWCPIYPYYKFFSYDKDGFHNSEYYPKGLKNNPHKHWDKN